MKNIEIQSLTRHTDYFEISVKFILDLPLHFSDLTNKKQIANSYGYDIEKIDDVEYFTYFYSYSYSNDTSAETIKEELIAELNVSKQKLNYFQLQDFDNLIGLSYNGTEWQ